MFFWEANKSAVQIQGDLYLYTIIASAYKHMWAYKETKLKRGEISGSFPALKKGKKN